MMIFQEAIPYMWTNGAKEYEPVSISGPRKIGSYGTESWRRHHVYQVPVEGDALCSDGLEEISSRAIPPEVTSSLMYIIYSRAILYLYILIVILLCPSSGHWCLIVIVPTENTCVIMDSLRPKDKTTKIEVARAIFPYINK